MSKFVITGGKTLSGEIEVYGAKNAAMKMIAASVLIKDKVILENVPDISDVQIIIDILKNNGAQITRNEHTLTINTTNLRDRDPDLSMVKKIRGSVVLIGSYLSRFKDIKLPQPGGCVIGSRPIETQLDALRQLKVVDSCENEIYHLSGENLSAGKIKLKEASVSATEISILASVLLTGETNIYNAAREPEIVDLVNFLKKAGANISGEGTQHIIISGVDNLHGIQYSIIPDRIETGTFITLAVATQSKIKITHCRPEHLESLLATLQTIGVEFEKGPDFIYVINSNNLKPIDIETAIYPGFPTDLQAPMGLILTQVNGESHLKENLFENRLGYINELVKMGANAKIINSKEVNIVGPTKLQGREIEGPDLRAGATLVLAGLAAVGQSIISNAEIVDRGYERIEERLKKVGAEIERIN